MHLSFLIMELFSYHWGSDSDPWTFLPTLIVQLKEKKKSVIA